VSIGLEVLEEVLNDVEGRHTAGDFGCMDVGVNPVSRLRVVSPRRRIRDGGKHQTAAKVRLSIGLDGEERWVATSSIIEPVDHLVISKESIKVVGHSPRLRCRTGGLNCRIARCFIT